MPTTPAFEVRWSGRRDRIGTSIGLSPRESSVHFSFVRAVLVQVGILGRMRTLQGKIGRQTSPTTSRSTSPRGETL
jgi:hypothetical protein